MDAHNCWLQLLRRGDVLDMLGVLAPFEGVRSLNVARGAIAKPPPGPVTWHVSFAFSN